MRLKIVNVVVGCEVVDINVEEKLAVEVNWEGERTCTPVKMLIIQMQPFKIQKVRAIFLIHLDSFRIKAVNSELCVK